MFKVRTKMKNDSVSLVVSSRLSVVTLFLSQCVHMHTNICAYVILYVHVHAYINTMHYIYIAIVYLCFKISKYLHIHYYFIILQTTGLEDNTDISLFVNYNLPNKKSKKNKTHVGTCYITQNT